MSISLWEVSFRAQYEYPFIDISARHPGTPLSLWCMWNRELLQVPTRNKPLLETLDRELKKGGWVIEKWGESRGGRTYFLKDTCAMWKSIWNLIQPSSGLIAPPVVFTDGWAYARVLSFEEEATRAIFKVLRAEGPAELMSKRELPVAVLPTHIWVHTLFADLTDKQKGALLRAHRQGYYVSPRKVGTEDIARASGVSRSTYEEHLRKAENRVMDALVPYLQLYAQGNVNPERLPMKATPASVPTPEPET